MNSYLSLCGRMLYTRGTWLIAANILECITIMDSRGEEVTSHP